MSSDLVTNTTTTVTIFIVFLVGLVLIYLLFWWPIANKINNEVIIKLIFFFRLGERQYYCL